MLWKLNLSFSMCVVLIVVGIYELIVGSHGIPGSLCLGYGVGGLATMATFREDLLKAHRRD